MNNSHRRQHYATPPPPLPHVQHMHHAYSHPYPYPPPPPQYQQAHPQQWYPYQQLSMPMSRPYQHYPPTMNPSYPSYNPQYPPPHIQQRPQSSLNPTSFSSIASHQDVLSPASSNASLHVPRSAARSLSSPRLAPSTPPPPPIHRLPYYPPLPWYSFSEGSFPSKSRRRRRRRPLPQSPSEPVALPPRILPTSEIKSASVDSQLSSSATPQPSEAAPAPSSLETPLTSHAPSESDSTQPTTPSSAVLPIPPRQPNATIKSNHRPHPSVPIIPAIPHIALPSRPVKRTSVSNTSETVGSALPSNADHLAIAAGTAEHAATNNALNPTLPEIEPEISPVKVAPKSWADLVKSKVPKPVGGLKTSENNMPGINGLQHPKAASIVEVLRDFGERPETDRVSFIEPRGLVNTGNMCYMNSVLQILVFCVPFYDLLEQLGRRATHSFKSETPLVDAMIMFMHEYRVIDSAESVEKLRLRLRKAELEQYGEAFIPECVYEIIRRLPRFSSMRRGHQQDAEEFLGFLLEEMHDECSRATRSTSPTGGVASPASESAPSESAGDSGWLEVGPKQKAAITRSSGTIINESPITKIFGGKLRSELRVPGMKHSVTLEPYQPLQLDIGAPQVNNIVEALKGLTRSETLHGEFHSPRGVGVAATKQVTIETLPQVLILHLKRFQYDNAGGTQKIWKKIGYPLNLEIPKEVFPQHKRGGILVHGGLPKYRLIGVVYHHGKSASGGHYTVDVRRQDDKEWIRLDDTVIRRVRSEEVAAGGSEEDPKALAVALQQHKDAGNDHYDGFANEGENKTQVENAWSQVNGTNSAEASAGGKWSGVANGTSTPRSLSGQRTPTGRMPVRDNKVAYLLFYEKIKA